MNRLHRTIFTAIVLVSMIGFTCSVQGDEGFGIDVRAGTMGVGAEISGSLFPHTRLRGGINYLIWEFDSTIDDVDYSFETEFNSISALLDIHPFGGAFFLSGGVFFNNNSVGVDGSLPPESFPAEYQSFNFLSDLVSITGDVEFNPVAPYVGLGWRSNSNDNGWGIGLELGVLYQGAPDVTNLRVNAPVDVNDIDEVQQFLTEQEREIEDELSWFQWYPVASLLLTYHF
ncbi:MAG: hypothetical protein KJN87_05365 [Desulfofustis sp.]|nr:hypothetical protein [Desulfofustis sp.]NNF46571.1 hypothetical protein [Desulfofustis sp.]